MYQSKYKSSSVSLSDVLELENDRARRRGGGRGLKNTLKIMDEELPRSETSISNRQALMKELGMEKLMKRNKEQEKPLRTMLEVMSKSYLDNKYSSSLPHSDSSSPDSTRGRQDVSQRDDRRSARSTRSSEATETYQYMSSKTRPSTASLKKSSLSENRSGDLIIADVDESDTVLGDGKGALMDRPSSNYMNGASQLTAQSRPRTAGKPRAVGMAGPISSNMDESRRKFNKPRAYSANTNYSDWQGQSTQSDNGLTITDSLRTYSTQNNTSTSRSSVSSLYEPKHSAARVDEDRVLLNKLKEDADGIGLEKSNQIKVKELLEGDSEKPKYGSNVKKRDEGTAEKRGSGAITPPEIESATYNVGSSSIANQRPRPNSSTSSSTSNQRKSSAMTRMGDLEIGDVDDLDEELADLDIAPRVQTKPLSLHISKAFKGFPIDLQTAINLKMLIFGSSTGCFNDEWKYQSFSFSDLPQLMYGIVQKKGGPCGVLAAVQAVMLQEMLFVSDRLPGHRWNEPTREERSSCLCRALSRILWRAGDQRRAVVAIQGRQSHFDGGGRFREDGVTEKLKLYTFTEFEKLESFMKDAVREFELDGHSGVVLTLYSAILSRGVDKVVRDMDEPTNKLMGAHGYCTQDMVNLILSGRAVSNVFNDVMELDSGGVGPPMVLKGLSARNDIGLLSLFEHYRSCQVGTFYKTPRYPIWVVCSESHFSVLFSVRKELVNDWKAERRFDLFYYDGLAKQEEQIKLTIDTTNRYYKPPSDDDLVPPLEHCIRTKWKDAEIDWNGAEPIL